MVAFFIFMGEICYAESMNKALFYCLFLLTFTVLLASSAYAFDTMKDTYYFLRDDGEFSDEEKDEEAQYIHAQCTKNIMQSTYYNCECIAGAFRQTRDTDEKLRPQSAILNEIFEKPPEQCINTEVIAGKSYKFCNDYANTFRTRSTNNEDYCKCVANDVALRFKETPMLRSRHIENIRSDALYSCGRQYR